MRVALGLEYDGSRYHGWQSQEGLTTVQQMVERALSNVGDTPISVFCAGRTDTGVHATNQVLHFDCDNIRQIRAWIHGANSFLPKDIAIKWGKEVSDDFHARFTATARRYRYIIANQSIRPALLRGQVTWQYRFLDQKLMQEAAQILVGEHDFTSFRSTECNSKTPVRQMHRLNVYRRGDMVVIDLTANAFLHHMVRNIAGVLMAVGSEKYPVEWVTSVLEAKDRRLGAETAPPYGLYLVAIQYPLEHQIPVSPTGPLFLLETK